VLCYVGNMQSKKMQVNVCRGLVRLTTKQEDGDRETCSKVHTVVQSESQGGGIHRKLASAFPRLFRYGIALPVCR
jgi:hypothetical protein